MNAKYRLAARRRAEHHRHGHRLRHDPELLELLRAAAAIARPRPEPDPSGRRLPPKARRVTADPVARRHVGNRLGRSR